MLPEYDTPPEGTGVLGAAMDGQPGVLALMGGQEDHHARQIQAAAEAAERLRTGAERTARHVTEESGSVWNPATAAAMAHAGSALPAGAPDVASAAALAAATTSLPVDSFAPRPDERGQTGRREPTETLNSLGESPGKKSRREDGSPHFGGPPVDVAKAPPLSSPAHHAPPLFHGEHPRTVPTPGPQVFHMEEPLWARGLRGQLEGLHAKQDTALAQLAGTNRDVRRLGEQLSGMELRVEGQDARLERAEGRIGELEQEVQKLRERSVSPSPSMMRSSSPRFSATGSVMSERTQVDDFQIVVGGWEDAKRQEIEGEVTNMFQSAQAEALLKRIHVPYARSRYCRVELLYPDPNPRAKRDLQSTVLHTLRREVAQGSRLPQQEHVKLWVKRNRGPEERAKIRAIVSMKAVALDYVPEGDVDFDWAGRLWVKGREVLYHVGRKPPDQGAIMLQNGRGDDTGWYVVSDLFANLLGTTVAVLKSRMDMTDE